MKPSLFLTLALALPCTSPAQPADAAGRVEIAVQDARATGKVVARLNPPAAREAASVAAAVVIVNSTSGFDGRGDSYAKVLNDAGIATLEVDLFQGTGTPASPLHNLPQLEAARRWLAGQPGIDGGRIGVMGFSWGGSVALLAASSRFGLAGPSGTGQFMAHLALYPVCWKHHAAASGAKGGWPGVTRDAYRHMTGRPVHILAGGRDDYDGPAGCRPFLDALPADSRAALSLTVYPNATFAWDSRFGSAPYEAAARGGRGAGRPRRHRDGGGRSGDRGALPRVCGGVFREAPGTPLAQAGQRVSIAELSASC